MNKNLDPQVASRSFSTLIMGMAFILPFMYWCYLSFVSQMVIVHDAVNFHDMGSLLADKGWIEYFRTGPNREPIYPFLISLAMQIGEKFTVPFQDILKLFNIVILVITQFLSLLILRKLKINDWMTGATLLYLGFSPAIVNSELSLFSEGTTYPFVLGLILISATALSQLLNAQSPRSTLWGILLGFSLASVIFIKAMFEFITLPLLCIYLYLAVSALSKGNQKIFKGALILFLVALFTCQGILFAYKSLNKKYNGNFTLTDRGPWALYGNTGRRAQKLDAQHIGAVIAHIPGREFCSKFFNDELCAFSEGPYSEGIGMNKFSELMESGLTVQQTDQALIQGSFEKILTHPFSYAVLFFIESFKMFFWETTHIGFVAYPDWLSKIFNLSALSNALTSGMAFFSLLGFLFLFKFSWRQARSLFRLNGEFESPHIYSFVILTLLIPYILCYSLFFIVPRHVLAMAPLFLISISFFVQNMINTLHRNNNPPESKR